MSAALGGTTFVRRTSEVLPIASRICTGRQPTADQHKFCLPDRMRETRVRRGMKKSFLALVLAGCGHTAAYADATPASKLQLVTDISNGINVDVVINDLPLTRHEMTIFAPVPDWRIDVPAYYVRKGTNTITIKYVANLKSYPDAKLDLVIAGARLNPKTFTGCDDGDFDKRCEMTAKFELATGAARDASTISDTPANREALRAAYVAFHKRLSKRITRRQLAGIQG